MKKITVPFNKQNHRVIDPVTLKIKHHINVSTTISTLIIIIALETSFQTLRNSFIIVTIIKNSDDLPLEFYEE